MEKYKRLPDSELQVMLQIWEHDRQVDTGEIMRQLTEQMGRKPRLTLIQQSLNRLVEKGFVKCDKIGRLNHYTSLVNADEYKAQEAGSMLEKLYGNSPSKLFTALLRNNSFSSSDIEDLKKVLDESGE